jgi:predicted transcriptional regulator
VETVIRDRQADYYRVLAACDKAGQSTAFIEFSLAALLTALRDSGNPAASEQVGAPVSEQVVRILRACASGPMSKTALLQAAGLANAYLNYKRHIVPLLDSGLLEPTIPNKPNSRLQQYRLTENGRKAL